MDDLESEVSEMTIKNTVTKIAQTPSNLFKNVVKIIPNPFYLILNPMTFPIIILSALLLYLSGSGKFLTQRPMVLGGLFIFLIMFFIIAKLTIKPTWQEIML